MPRIDLVARTTGIVWRIEKRAGDAVAADDVVLVVESMKMEIPVQAPAAGRIAEVLVAGEDLVEEGQVVARMDAGE